MSDTKVEVAFELTVGDTPYFRLDDPVKGVLDGTEYRLAGPIWIDITSKVASVGIKRGKNRELERYSSGSANVVLHNEDRTFDPLNGSSPYAGNIIPRRAIRISTSGYTQFTGVIEDWNLDYDVSGKSNASIVAADAFTLLAQQSLSAGTAVAETTGARINNVLSMPTVAWPLAQRAIDTGSAEVAGGAYDVNEGALSYLQKVEASEQGQLFIDRNGYVRFVNGAVTPTTQGSWVLSRTNLVTNPSFETNTTGWNLVSGAVLTRVTTEAYSGTASLRVVSSVSVGSGAQLVQSGTVAGVTYVFSAWVKMPLGVSFRCRISDTTVGAAETIYTGTGNWQRVSSPSRVATTTTMWGYVQTLGTATTFFVDAAQLETGSTPTEYFDGSLPATFTKRYGWNGTANASTSYEETADVIAYPAFSDAGDGIPYVSATVSYGTELLYNQVTVSAPGFTSTQSNVISQVQYGITTTDVATLLSSANAVESLALFWVAKYGEPEYRFQDLVVSLDGIDGDLAEQVLQIEMGDIVQIKFTPNGIGDPIQRYGQVNKIEHNIGVDRHTITFGFGSLQFSFLVLDDTGFGILDENVLAF